MTTPELSTPRLLLRAFVPEDLEALAAIFADPEVMRMNGSGVRSRAETEASLVANAEKWRTRGCGDWAVTRRATGELLGLCGFVERAVIGYIYSRATWGQGIATEAAAACLAYGFERLGFNEVSASAAATNAASRHVLEKVGMRRRPNASFDDQGGVYYAITRLEWLAKAELPHITEES